MSTKKLLMATAVVLLLASGAVVNAPIQAQTGEEEQSTEESSFWFEMGMIDLETEIVLEDPYHHVSVNYTRILSSGELPECYVFSWETTLDGEDLYSEELESEPVSEEKSEYTVSTVHMKVVPDHIPEGEYTTELTVYARFDDGTEVEMTTISDTIYFQGYAGTSE
ncbi:MAG: hypothetical protein ACOCTR_03555 [Candidatus Natronoplasma sp.]